MELHPHPSALRIDQAVSVRAETMHMPVGSRNAAVGHHDSNLMQSFRQHSPKVPVSLRRAKIGLRIALHRMVKVRKLQRIANEEHRRVVAHQVPVALIGIELDRKTANVALRISSASLARHRREPHKHISTLAHRGKKARTCIVRYIVRNGEMSESPAPLSMHTTFRNHLTVEMRQLLHHPQILKQHRSAPSRSQRIAIILHRRTNFISQKLLLFHNQRIKVCQS